MFGHLLGWYTIYTFLGLLPPNGILPVQKSLCVQVLHSPILAALLHGTRAAAVSQTLWHDTRNGITELPQSAPPIFGWAAIMLGIDRHSSSAITSYILTVFAYNFTGIKTPLIYFQNITWKLIVRMCYFLVPWNQIPVMWYLRHGFTLLLHFLFCWL